MSEIWAYLVSEFNVLLEHPLLVAIVIVLILGSRVFTKRNENQNPFTNLGLQLTTPILESLKDTFAKVGNALRVDNADTRSNVIAPNVSGVIHDLYEKIEQILSNLIQKISDHIKMSMKIFGENQKDYLWRISGTLIMATLLVIFVIADVIQALNNLALIPGMGALINNLVTEEQPWLGYLHVSILIASIGSSFTLALIYADTRGLTHFVPWEGLVSGEEETSVRNIAKNGALIVFFLNLLLIGFIASARLESLPVLADRTQDAFKLLANIGQVFIIIPMLITTLFLFYGIMVLVVMYLAFLGMILFALKGLKGSLYLLKGVMSVMQPSSTLIIGLLLTVFGYIFIQLGLVIALIIYISVRIIALFEIALDTLITILELLFSIPALLTDLVRKIGSVLAINRRPFSVGESESSD